MGIGLKRFCDSKHMCSAISLLFLFMQPVTLVRYANIIYHSVYRLLMNLIHSGLPSQVKSTLTIRRRRKPPNRRILV